MKAIRVIANDSPIRKAIQMSKDWIEMIDEREQVYQISKKYMEKANDLRVNKVTYDLP